MAYFNFLSNECSGRIGDTYYRNENGRDVFTDSYIEREMEKRRNPYRYNDYEPVVTARIGNYHGAEINKKCWKAFTSEQRVAAILYKYFWDFLGLQKGNRNPLNVVSNFIKDLVKNHEFEPIRFYNIYPLTPKVTLSEPQYNTERKTFEVSYQNNETFSDEQEPQLLFTMFKHNGENLGVKMEWAAAGDFAFATKYTPDNAVYFLCLVAVKVDGRYKIVGCKLSIKKFYPIDGETWYPPRMNNGIWQFVTPETLQGKNVVAHYDGETLIFG